MENKRRTWRPNQSGTFSNRVAVHGVDDQKLFVIEHGEYTDTNERAKITSVIVNGPEALEALQEINKDLKILKCNLLEAEKSNTQMIGYSDTVQGWIDRNESVISKSLSHD